MIRVVIAHGDPGDETRSDADYDRRYDRLITLGFEPMDAHELAESPTVTLKQVLRLLTAGCEHRLVPKILL